MTAPEPWHPYRYLSPFPSAVAIYLAGAFAFTGDWFALVASLALAKAGSAMYTYEYHAAQAKRLSR